MKLYIKVTIMTKIFFIRHGQTLWNQDRKYQGHSDIDLSEQGVEQAQKLADYLVKKQVKLDVVYASDLSRAYQTASIVANSQDIKVIVNQDFREMNFGVWEGLTFKDIQLQYADLAKTWITAPENLEIPSGESFAKVKERAEKAIMQILKIHLNQNIAIVSHGGTLRTIFCSLLEIPLTKMWQFKLDNTALTIFEFFKETAVLNLLNSTAHLDEF